MRVASAAGSCRLPPAKTGVLRPPIDPAFKGGRAHIAAAEWLELARNGGAFACALLSVVMNIGCRRCSRFHHALTPRGSVLNMAGAALTMFVMHRPN